MIRGAYALIMISACRLRPMCYTECGSATESGGAKWEAVTCSSNSVTYELQ